MSSFKLVKWKEDESLQPMYERPKAKFPCFAEGALYEGAGCRVLMTTTEEWEWGSLKLELDCEGPPDNHWLSFELDALCDIGEIMGVSTGSETDMFLLEHGIAPFQRFYVHLTVLYTKDYWGEYDSSFDWEVLNVEPWCLDRICTEWEAYWARKRVLMPWCQSS